MAKIKKIIYVICLIFIITISINVHAATPFILGNTKGTTDPQSLFVEESATVTINNTSADDTFEVYKIIDVFYNSTANTITYEFTKKFKEFLSQSDIYKDLTMEDYYNLTSGDILSGSTQTSSTLDKLVSKFAAYTYAHPFSPTANMSTYNNKATASLPAGVYLIRAVSTQKVYAVMVANLTPVATSGSWQITDVTINAKASAPSVTKYIGKEGQTIGSYSYGDEVPCIMVARIPDFPTNTESGIVLLGDVVAPVFNLPTSYNSFVIKDGDTVLTTKSDGTVVDSSGNVVATISIPNNYWTGQLGASTLTISLNYKYLKSTKVTVSYKLPLSTNATISTTGNTNTAGLIINYDVYHMGVDDSGGAAHYSPYYTYTTIYTYGIDLLAYKKGSKSTVLSDMTFDVYKDSALTEKVGTITTDSSGKGTLAGVAEGTYYLKNTKTKSGYNLATTTSMKVKISGSQASTTDGYYKVEIEVAEAPSLPLTGGIGTIIYTGIGILIVLVSVILIILYNQKNKK